MEKTSIWDTNLLLLTDSGYKPNVQKLLQPDTGVEFVVEIHSYGKWFRILRLKNNRRTHDFIINDFSTKEIAIENDRSQRAILQCKEDNDIKEIFKGGLLMIGFIICRCFL